MGGVASCPQDGCPNTDPNTNRNINTNTKASTTHIPEDGRHHILIEWEPKTSGDPWPTPFVTAQVLSESHYLSAIPAHGKYTFTPKTFDLNRSYRFFWWTPDISRVCIFIWLGLLFSPQSNESSARHDFCSVVWCFRVWCGVWCFLSITFSLVELFCWLGLFWPKVLLTLVKIQPRWQKRFSVPLHFRVHLLIHLLVLLFLLHHCHHLHALQNCCWPL